MNMTIQCIFAFGAILAFSLMIEAPKKCLIINGCLGSIAWAVYLLVECNSSIIISTFVTSLVLAGLSHILARILKVPVTALLIPAILTIVPGTGMYQTVYDLFTSNVDQALYSLIDTLGAAGAIAIAVFIIDAFVAIITKEKRRFLKL